MNKKRLKSYRIWRAMKARCYAPSSKRGYYKADNIQVCDRWRNSYENFMADMGEMPGEEYSIERIDVHKDYCPENCKWIEQKRQSQNRRNTIWVVIDGHEMCLKEASRYMGVNYSTMHKDYRRGRLQNVINSNDYLSKHKKEEKYYEQTKRI